MIGIVLLVPVLTALLCYLFRNRKAIEYINFFGAVLLTGASIF